MVAERRSAASPGYVGRFAPSPTGLLHAGSLVAALASWLDARAHGGRWLVRIEDIDTPRCVPGAARAILGQLAACGLHADETPWFQSQGEHRYAAALERLVAADMAYPCGCSRREIELAQLAPDPFVERRAESPNRLQPEAAAPVLTSAARVHPERVYPGTCRPEHGGLRGRPARAMRLKVDTEPRIEWTDRRLGAQQQDLLQEVGDFVIHRADGLWAYQLAVVVDDAAQGVTDVVRGEDLADNTARQIHLQRCLGLPKPGYLHTPLVLGENGHKLSKQNGALALDLGDPLAAVRRAGATLGLHHQANTTSQWLKQAVGDWSRHWMA